ncbi:MAG: four helix bundle protein, partial [Acidobacteriaceae bacterium]
FVTKGRVRAPAYRRTSALMEQQTEKFQCKLIVWERAVEMCVAVYTLTRAFPREEIYGLTSQMRRASVSIASNIAEGYGRTSKEQYRHFLGIAQGSYLELQTQLVIANRLSLTSDAASRNAKGLALEVGKMLAAMIRKLSAGEPSRR